MDDTNLTRKAVEEILLAVHCPTNHNGTKLSLLEKPSKRFLRRTIKFGMEHNKREIIRTQLNCQNKLKELDDRQRNLSLNTFYKGREKLPIKKMHTESKCHPKQTGGKYETNFQTSCRIKKLVRRMKPRYERNKYRNVESYLSPVVLNSITANISQTQLIPQPMKYVDNNSTKQSSKSSFTNLSRSVSPLSIDLTTSNGEISGDKERSILNIDISSTSSNDEVDSAKNSTYCISLDSSDNSIVDLLTSSETESG